jgi:enolase-phosphatase E1
MINAIVTDIEGTTSSLSFVKDTLFPYARAHLAEFVRSHINHPDIISVLSETRRLIEKALSTEQVIELLIQWIDEDKKATPLKTLQGLIWADGYQKGAFKGHLYLDAAENLIAWKKQGLSLYVYSSGSVQAQKLLFSHTDYGDLTPLFSGYFDTHVGGKKEPESYRIIAEKIGLPPDELLFLSDIEDELDAAQTAGFKTVWLTRNSQPNEVATHCQVRNFNQIKF